MSPRQAASLSDHMHTICKVLENLESPLCLAMARLFIILSHDTASLLLNFYLNAH